MENKKMDLSALEKTLGIFFKNKNLLREALTHRSYLNEHQGDHLSSNERLEFLGDAILGFLISKILFEQFPNFQEGILTASRSRVVQTKSLSKIAERLSLGTFLLLSKGEEEGGGRKNPGLLENAFEALLGAIFLDQGLEEAENFVRKQFGQEIANLKPSELKDAKSLLQEIAQEKEKITPVYRVISQNGPDHAKIFTVGVYLGAKMIGQGEGASKKEAEEEAAKMALKDYVS